MRLKIIHIFLATILLYIMIYLFHYTKEGFVTIPTMTIPAGNQQSAALDTLNGNWRSILDYLSKNPEKALPFITDVKDKFFSDTCSLKQPRIDFQNLANTYRPVFT